MANHTLILTTDKKTIPVELSIDYVTHLINQGLALTEYFGLEIDNDADFISDDMKEVSKKITYIEIFFETPYAINYDALTETEVEELILNILNHSENPSITTDGKDINIYL
ncbi:hypothetical protein [Flavobacterium sp. 3-210]